jgi:hypothetical protein
MSKTYQVYIGIDQTGAVTAAGNPKPLFASIYVPKTKVLHTNIRLSSAKPSTIRATIADLGLATTGSIFVAADSVFGLPASLNVPWIEIFRRSQDFQFAGRTHGAKTAHAFFNSFLPPKGQFKPQRLIEKMTNANSVFNLVPYQRNIGCGSYRIIRDLGAEMNAFRIWPFQRLATNKISLAESYPSLIWKVIFGHSNRKAQALIENRLFKKLVANRASHRDENAEDASALALGSYIFTQHNKALSYRLPQAIREHEGWILGVRPTP